MLSFHFEESQNIHRQVFWVERMFPAGRIFSDLFKILHNVNIMINYGFHHNNGDSTHLQTCAVLPKRQKIRPNVATPFITAQNFVVQHKHSNSLLNVNKIIIHLSFDVFWKSEHDYLKKRNVFIMLYYKQITFSIKLIEIRNNYK